MPVSGPDFVSLQVRDLAASAAFYEQHLSLTRLPVPNPDAVVFATLYIFSLLGLVISLVSDLMYMWIDPRIRLEGRA